MPMLPPVQVAVPALLRTRPFRSFSALPLILNVPAARMLVAPAPLIVPADQVDDPVRVSVPPPVSAPPLSVKLPVIVEAVAKLKEPPEITSEPSLCTALTV